MKLRGAVIGVGYLGNFHAQKYKVLTDGLFAPKIQFVGVCDQHFPQAEKVAKENGVQAFSKIQDLVGEVDLVTIATVTSSHYEVAKFFLQNGIHINVEKPMTVTVAEANELIRLAKEKGLTLCVGHSERFNPVYRELKNKLKSQGKKPRYAELNRHAPYKSRGADVSVVHDLMIHDIDLAFSLERTFHPDSDLAPKVIQVNGGKVISPTLDFASATLQFSSGLEVRISVSRLASVMTRAMKVYTNAEVFEANLQTGDLSLMANTTETIQCGKGDNLLLETEAFFYACLGEKPAQITGVQGMQSLSVAEEICQRIEQGK